MADEAVALIDAVAEMAVARGIFAAVLEVCVRVFVSSPFSFDDLASNILVGEYDSGL